MTSSALLVASPGGHLDELFDFAERLPQQPSERVWVTAASSQTTALLASENVIFVPGVGARQGLRAAGTLPGAVRILKQHKPEYVLSTGAALSVPFLVAARALRVPTYFIDSATRLRGPSVTGKMARWIPGVHLYHQGVSWPDDRWHAIGSVFDGYEAVPATSEEHALKVVVTLGSERFPFIRAPQSITAGLDPRSDVLWQLGHTPAPAHLPGRVERWVPSDELRMAIAAANTVISHAGVGSILCALRVGLCPVILPRLGHRGEHVDDHQMDLADALSARGVAVIVRPGEDVVAAIAAARERRVVRRPGAHLPMRMQARAP